MLKIPNDIIVMPEEGGKWILMNVFAKTCLAVEHTIFEFLKMIQESSEDEIYQNLSNKKWSVWDIERFSNVDGLMHDPTRYVRNQKDWPQEKLLDARDLVKELTKHHILVTNEKEYRNKFQNKKSLLDFDHFGNFHEQLGQYLLLISREKPEKWWLQQKFNDDLKSMRNNLYGAIQATFLKKYFERRLKPGSTIIDIGCGVGFYSNMIASMGLKVMGIDPNEEYIELAKKNAVDGATFERIDIGSPEALDKIPTSSADYIFMSDALLFYFVSPRQDKKVSLEVLLSDIRRIIKNDGIFISLEPHYTFWLSPWLGNVNNPFTVLTEYRIKNFGVTATMSQLIQSLCKAGFVVTWMEELVPDPSFEKIDRRAFHFANQFPLWHLFELKLMTK